MLRNERGIFASSNNISDNNVDLVLGRCSMIVHVEYRCPECDKVFNCPANLASHRRWHKPRPPTTTNNNIEKYNNNNSDEEENNNSTTEALEDSGYNCEFCSKSFKRQHSLKKHVVQAHPEAEGGGKESTSSSPMSSPTSRYSIAELLGQSQVKSSPTSGLLQSFYNDLPKSSSSTSSFFSPTKIL